MVWRGTTRWGPRLARRWEQLTIVAAAGVLVWLIPRHDAPPAALLLFVALLVYGENSSVFLTSKATLSPSLAVIVAYAAAFPNDDVLLGCAVLGLSGGISLVRFRHRKFHSATFHGSQYLLAAAATAAVYQLADDGLGSVAAVIAAAGTFALVNLGLVGTAIVLEEGEPVRRFLTTLAPELPNYLAFAVLGALVGHLCTSVGVLAVVLLFVPVVIARATFQSVLELRSAHEATIGVFLKAIRVKDAYTGAHTERVARYSVYIAEELGFSPGRLDHLRQSALMHDIGKLAVPKHLLNKPGKLTDEEFKQVQRHAHICIDILDLVDFLRPMTAAAAGHHSRYDGGGYGGTGQHPIEAYIVAVADAYDAMTSTRAYRRALPMDVAFGELRAKSGSQFHPECVEALIAAIERRGEKHGLGHEETEVAYEVPPPVVGVGSAGLGDTIHTQEARA